MTRASRGVTFDFNIANVTPANTRIAGVQVSTNTSATANPYICPQQLGVSASANNQVLGFTGASNGNTTFSYYYILAASYDGPPSTANGTSTSATSCDKSKWTKITSAAIQTRLPPHRLSAHPVTGIATAIASR